MADPSSLPMTSSPPITNTSLQDARYLDQIEKGVGDLKEIAMKANEVRKYNSGPSHNRLLRHLQYHRKHRSDNLVSSTDVHWMMWWW